MSEQPQEQTAGLPENAYLVINSQVIPLVRIITKIGRRLDNDLVIQDPLISRDHVEIRFENGQFVAYDLGSTGGTFINNQKVDRSVLYSGDILSLATVPMMFVHDSPGVETKSEKTTGNLK